MTRANGWESVYLCFVACLGKCGCIFVDVEFLFLKKSFWVRSKVRTNSDSRALAAAKRCIGHFGSDGRLQSGSSPPRESQWQKTGDHQKKAKIAKPNAKAESRNDAKTRLS